MWKLLISQNNTFRLSSVQPNSVIKGSWRGWGTPTEKIFVETEREKFFPFQTRRSETSVSYQWADKFSEPGHVLVPRNPRLKIQFLSATATTLKLPFILRALKLLYLLIFLEFEQCYFQDLAIMIKLVECLTTGWRIKWEKHTIYSPWKKMWI